uniref:Phosphatidylethanolamine N-methyltransferase n=1 Tax=Spongospora subterranea TaxID=70186 RepID=A0A0H5RJK3_9EUKA|eukprot:CRZ08879.1 hypothetical protein [Spongospora subterranea]
MTAEFRHRPLGSSENNTTAQSSQVSTIAMKRGFDEHGLAFDVPSTMSVFHVLAYPSLWSGPTLIVLLTMLFNVITAFAVPTSSTTALAVFFFFRLSYNVGLGVLLHYQSNYRLISKFVTKCLTRRGSKSSQFILWLAQGRMSHVPDFKSVQYPDCFNAWLAFRFLVDIVLCNDGLSYLILVFKCWTLPERLGLFECLQYLLGILLALFNYWAKVDAHRCIGDYSWYWGDNFFVLDQHLTFDGIFALVPHPMYTVGYALYYGLALISRSYTILIASLIAHMLQIGFLVFVENPHIDRTYGKDEAPMSTSDTILYDPVQGLFPSHSDMLLFLRFDVFRANDLALILLSVYMIAITMMLPSTSACIAHALFWLILHWLGIGIILRRQSDTGWWNNHFVSQGLSLHVAFLHWKTLYNSSRTLYLVAFGICALRLSWFPTTLADISTGWVANVIGGISLLLITLYSTVSSYQALGDFGTFYGDFFIPSDYYQPKTRYLGIYRFLNNPECVTGYAGLHGLALITQSWTVFWLALTAQALNFIFIRIVEVPHMEKIYADTVRQHTPAEELIRNLVLDKISDELISEAERIQERATQEIFLIYKRLANQEFQEKVTSYAKISCPETISSGMPLKCVWVANERHRATDWIGIYKVDVPSAPGLSRGRWVSVPDTDTCSGEVVFPMEKMPKYPGVYELRYHTGHYQVIGKAVFKISSLRRLSKSATGIESQSDKGNNIPTLSRSASQHSS